MKNSLVAQIVKVLVVVMITFYFLYLVIEERHTRTWDSTKLMCVASVGQCENVGEFNTRVFNITGVQNVTGTGYRQYSSLVSVCGKVGSQDTCLAAEDLQSLVLQMDLLDIPDLTSDYLATLVDPLTKKPSYFHFAYIILFVCFASLGMSLSFDLSPLRCVERTPVNFARMKDSLFIARLNFLLSIVNSGIMLESASQFNLMHSEHCTLHASTQIGFCQFLLEETINMRSIVATRFVFVAHYAYYAFILAILLVVSSVVAYALTVMQLTADMRVNPNEPASGGLHIYRDHLTGGVIISAEPYETIITRNRNRRNPQQNKDRCHQLLASLRVERNSSNCDGDCAVCLNRLFPGPSLESSPGRYSYQPGISLPSTNQLFAVDEQDDNNHNSATRQLSPRFSFSLDRNSNHVSTVVSIIDPDQDNIESHHHRDRDHVTTGASGSLEMSVLGGSVEFSVVQLQCTHLFHFSCIASWVVNKHTCPVCRSIFDPEVENV